MLQNLLLNYQDLLSSFFSRIDVKEVEKVLELFQACKGMLIFSGVGKSALIAEKIAVTMTSTGTRAFFLSPLEAMHGDIGIVSQDDLFVAISKSGETDELLNLIPYIRTKGAKVVVFTSNPKSRLGKAADEKIILPVEKELCAFNLVPTISTTSQIILGDTLAVALMHSRKFTLDEFAMNHPAGTIGKRITVRVRDLMITEPLIPFCSPDDRLIDILGELSEKRAGCICVVDEEKKLLGIFTDGDLRRALQKAGGEVLEKTMKELMTLGGRTIDPDALAWDALKLMEHNQKSPIMVLPVISHDRTVQGLIKMHDILQSGI